MLNQTLSMVEQCNMELHRQGWDASTQPFAKLLMEIYSIRGQANQNLKDYQSAHGDYNKLIELAQYEDLPTEKLCEYLAMRTSIRAHIRHNSTQQQHL